MARSYELKEKASSFFITRPAPGAINAWFLCFFNSCSFIILIPDPLSTFTLWAQPPLRTSRAHGCFTWESKQMGTTRSRVKEGCYLALGFCGCGESLVSVESMSFPMFSHWAAIIESLCRGWLWYGVMTWPPKREFFATFHWMSIQL